MTSKRRYGQRVYVIKVIGTENTLVIGDRDGFPNMLIAKDSAKRASKQNTIDTGSVSAATERTMPRLSFFASPGCTSRPLSSAPLLESFATNEASVRPSTKRPYYSGPSSLGGTVRSRNRAPSQRPFRRAREAAPLSHLFVGAALSVVPSESI